MSDQQQRDQFGAESRHYNDSASYERPEGDGDEESGNVGARLTDLCGKDKARIGDLIHQVVKLGKEKETALTEREKLEK